MTKLNDDSLMPFGKYKGLQMQEVPVEYLQWYYHNGSDGNVKQYIRDSLDALKMENRDLIWK